MAAVAEQYETAVEGGQQYEEAGMEEAMEVSEERRKNGKATAERRSDCRT